LTYLIIQCQRCGKICVTPQRQKVRTCPFCGFKIKVERVRPLGESESQQEIRKMATKLKEAGRKGIYSSSHHQ